LLSISTLSVVLFGPGSRFRVVVLSVLVAGAPCRQVPARSPPGAGEGAPGRERSEASRQGSGYRETGASSSWSAKACSCSASYAAQAAASQISSRVLAPMTTQSLVRPAY
ncbi:MAG: hypothetical protein QOE05_2633, partial [Actinomycetota bacterium]|nr:hypothetical protein [Actinomycetota bacterium]